ncbi:molybdopterin cofactor-binding domain-containing protein, partial [Lysinibacillus sp. GbtcB16]|uniref:molybdopterin cofactor-binding domain-containing protein n=1 Tax=Lysinibacillus sp. GbtcB16 TaxID=2824761 RepID=UPI001C2F681F
PGPMGQEIVPTDGAIQVWGKVKESPLWAKRGAAPVQAGEPWIRRGVGASMVMHGAGLGLGIPDHSGGRIALTPDGKLQAS